MRRALLIGRAEVFSPNSADKDRAILRAVAQRLQGRGWTVDELSEEALVPASLEWARQESAGRARPVGADSNRALSAPTAPHPSPAPYKRQMPEADICLSMGRLPATLAWLRLSEAEGRRVVNSPRGVERCARGVVDGIMRSRGIPVAPLYNVGGMDAGSRGYWLKRAGGAAQSHADVCHTDYNGVPAAVESFASRGIDEVLITEHVAGDVVKFYGVDSGRDDSFFRWYYPTDDGDTKFGDETVNGKAHHYTFSADALHRDVARLAHVVGVTIYGGDCIVRPDGSYVIIDFNDWPSFSRCRDAAAAAIADAVTADIS